MALLFAVLLGVGVSVLAYFNHYFHQSHYIRAAENLLNTEISQIVDLWPVFGGEKVLDSLIKSSGESGEKFYALRGDHGALVMGNLPRLPPHAAILGNGILLFHLPPMLTVGSPLKPGTYAVKTHNFDNGSELMVGLRMDDIAAQYEFMQLLSVSTIIIMVIVILTSFIISTFVVSRTNRIASTARNIMETGDLSRRITIDSNWDDLSFVALVLNEMLERIDGLVRDVRQVADNIAHDLRTPLTRMRNRIENMADNPKVAEDPVLSDFSAALINDAEHLLGTFSALLRISNIESGKQTAQFTRTDLNILMHDVVELYEAIAEDRGITLHYKGVPAPFDCDHNLLFQAFANVLDNAIKFTPQGGVITAVLAQHDTDITVTISDSGAGIPDEEKTKVFQRFYRGDKSRQSPGSGLGLSLVGAIVALHKGTISLRDNNPGLSVEISLPLRLRPQPDGTQTELV